MPLALPPSPCLHHYVRVCIFRSSHSGFVRCSPTAHVIHVSPNRIQHTTSLVQARHRAPHVDPTPSPALCPWLAPQTTPPIAYRLLFLWWSAPIASDVFLTLIHVACPLSSILIALLCQPPWPRQAVLLSPHPVNRPLALVDRLPIPSSLRGPPRWSAISSLLTLVDCPRRGNSPPKVTKKGPPHRDPTPFLFLEKSLDIAMYLLLLALRCRAWGNSR